MRASIKENSQRTTTLTDNKKRDYENEGSSMHEDSCIGINYAHTHMFPKCFKSHHTLLGFALYFMSSILILVAVTIYSILTCTRIPWRDSHCENGFFRCCLYIIRSKLHRPIFACFVQSKIPLSLVSSLFLWSEFVWMIFFRKFIPLFALLFSPSDCKL